MSTPGAGLIGMFTLVPFTWEQMEKSIQKITFLQHCCRNQIYTSFMFRSDSLSVSSPAQLLLSGWTPSLPEHGHGQHSHNWLWECCSDSHCQHRQRSEARLCCCMALTLSKCSCPWSHSTAYQRWCSVDQMWRYKSRCLHGKDKQVLKI